MTLLQLCKRLFSYLVAFREQVDGAAPPGFDETQKEILGVFEAMEAQVARQPSLAPLYKRVRYALVALVDEVVLNSGWKFASQWERDLLEERFFKTNVAGDRFYELAGKLGGAPVEVAAVFYYCLALGFRGHFAYDDEHLLALKKDLLGQLQRQGQAPEDILIRRSQYAPQLSPARLRRLWRWRTPLYIFLGLLALFFIVDRYVVWPWMTSPVTKVAVLADQRLSRDTAISQQLTPQPTPARATATKAPPAKKVVAAPPKPVPLPPPKKQPAAAPFAKGYWVQAGTFNGPLSAAGFRRRLAAAKFKSRIVLAPRSHGRTWYLVVLGPYPSRDEAAGTLGALSRDHAIKPFVVDASEAATWRSYEKGGE